MSGERVESGDPWTIVRHKQDTITGLRLELMTAEDALKETRVKLRSARSTLYVLWCVIALMFLGDLVIIFTPKIVSFLGL